MSILRDIELAGLTRSGTLHLANGREPRGTSFVFLARCRTDLRLMPVPDPKFYPDRPRCKRCWPVKPKKLKLGAPSREVRLSDHERWA